MLEDLLLFFLGALLSPILNRFFDIFRSKYKIEPNPQFYNAKVVQCLIKFSDKVEPYLWKFCGIFSIMVGITLVIVGFQVNKMFDAFLLLPYFLGFGCMFYTGIFPFLITPKQQDGKSNYKKPPGT